MAVLNSSIIVGDLSVTGQIDGTATEANNIYAEAAAATGLTSGYKKIKVVTTMPTTPEADVLYLVVE